MPTDLDGGWDDDPAAPWRDDAAAEAWDDEIGPSVDLGLPADAMSDPASTDDVEGVDEPGTESDDADDEPDHLPGLLGASHFDTVLDGDGRDAGEVDPLDPEGLAEHFVAGDVDALGVVAVDGAEWIDRDVLGEDGSGANSAGLQLAAELGLWSGVAAGDGVTDVTAGLWQVLLHGDDDDGRELARAALVLLVGGNDEP